MHLRITVAVAVAAIVVLPATAQATRDGSPIVAFADPVGDASPLASAASPLLGEGALDLAHVSLRIVRGELRVTVTTHGAPALRPFIGYDVTAGSDGRCPGRAVEQGFPVELRVRAGADGRGTLVVKACSAQLAVPVRIVGRTVEGRVRLTSLPEVRRTMLAGIHAISGFTDSADQGTMRVFADDAKTSRRLAVP